MSRTAASLRQRLAHRCRPSGFRIAMRLDGAATQRSALRARVRVPSISHHERENYDANQAPDPRTHYPRSSGNVCGHSLQPTKKVVAFQLLRDPFQCRSSLDHRHCHLVCAPPKWCDSKERNRSVHRFSRLPTVEVPADPLPVNEALRTKSKKQ